MAIEPQQYCFIYKRASFDVYKKYGINKLELWLLYTLSWYLRHRNMVVVGKVSFFDAVTGNNREQFKMNGYLEGLIKAGFVGTYEYVSAPGTVSIGLSDLGVSVINCYTDALNAMAERYKESPYRVGSQPSVTQEPPLKYKVSQTAIR